MFVNMDETAVYFEAKTRSIVQTKGARTVSTQCSGSSNWNITACVLEYENGEIYPYLTFNRTPGGPFEIKLLNVFPEIFVGCCQLKDWIDKRSLEIWIEKIWKPYVDQYGSSVYFLGDLACHK